MVKQMEGALSRTVSKVPVVGFLCLTCCQLAAPIPVPIPRQTWSPQIDNLHGPPGLLYNYRTFPYRPILYTLKGIWPAIIPLQVVPPNGTLSQAHAHL